MSEDPQESLDLFDDHEEVVSEDGKKVTRRGIYLLPNLLTTASLFSGFFSIVSAIDGNFIASGMALFAAQMLDGLDGRVARLTNSQSLFGAQYDSLCDVISFGLAPAIIVFLWGLDSMGQTGWVFSFFYVAAAALRLARFNTFIGSEDTYFKGLPSPVASGMVVYFVWAMSSYGIQGEEVGSLLAILTAVLTGCVSLLMVVNVPYYSFK
jgi:CDP-diacylglycerol--serine O-phosphatidyltransferase